MRILGLDPGSLNTGYGLLQKVGNRLEALAVGRIRCARSAPLPERLGHLAGETRLLLERWQPEIVVVEAPFRGINARSLIVLAEARGALLAAAALAGAEIREYSPAEVKTAVTGNGRAEKEQVARMVRLLLHLGDDPLSHDATDALAVALCAAQRSKMDGLRQSRAMGATSR